MTMDLETLRAIKDACRVALCYAEADVYEAEGDLDGAAWKRLDAEGRDEESMQAWVRMMARRYRLNGTEPDLGSYERERILAAMADLQAQKED